MSEHNTCIKSFDIKTEDSKTHHSGGGHYYVWTCKVNGMPIRSRTDYSSEDAAIKACKEWLKDLIWG